MSHGDRGLVISRRERTVQVPWSSLSCHWCAHGEYPIGDDVSCTCKALQDHGEPCGHPKCPRLAVLLAGPVPSVMVGVLWYGLRPAFVNILHRAKATGLLQLTLWPRSSTYCSAYRKTENSQSGAPPRQVPKLCPTWLDGRCSKLTVPWTITATGTRTQGASWEDAPAPGGLSLIHI